MIKVKTFARHPVSVLIWVGEYPRQALLASIATSRSFSSKLPSGKFASPGVFEMASLPFEAKLLNDIGLFNRALLHLFL